MWLDGFVVNCNPNWVFYDRSKKFMGLFKENFIWLVEIVVVVSQIGNFFFLKKIDGFIRSGHLFGWQENCQESVEEKFKLKIFT